MDPRLQRKRDLEEHRIKDYDLLRRLEDQLRYESEPMRQAKLRKQIAELREQIAARKAELEPLEKILAPRLEEIVGLYLSASFERDQFAELDQAGETDPDRITLLRPFRMSRKHAHGVVSVF